MEFDRSLRLSRQMQEETQPALRTGEETGKEEDVGMWGLPEMIQVVYGTSLKDNDLEPDLYL